MANKKISQLTEVTNPTSTDVIPVVNASETKKAQLGNLPISDATQSALDGKQDTLGYTAENVANRSTDVDADKTSLIKYPVVKAVYDWAVSLFATISQLNTKQDTLVSGTNIKTINSESLLGSGNIAIDLSPISVDGDKVSIAADTTATTQTTAVIQATDTNSGIAIVPNGTGAITAQVPDGTTAGGNARGDYSVDLQRVRSSADQVAGSNNSVITGGENNYLNASNGFIGGGKGNNLSSQYATISGGQSNTASTNTHATVVGGYQNSSTGQYSISGGYSNVASNTGAVALGYDNTASGFYSVSFGRQNSSTNGYTFTHGITNTVSGQVSAAFGLGNNITGAYGYAFGRQNSVLNQPGACIGQFNSTDGYNAIAMGYEASGKITRSLNFSSGKISAVGDAQFMELTRAKEDTLTSGATTTVTDEIILMVNNNNAWNVTVKYSAVVTGITGTATGVNVGDTKFETLTIGFKRVSPVTSNVGTINILSTNEDSSMSTASFAISPGTSQDMQMDFTAPTFSGGGSITTRVVAKVEITQVQW